MANDGLLKNVKDGVRAVATKVEQGFDSFTGKAALQKVTEFAQELDAVNDAMATRIYDLLDRDARLRERLGKVEADNLGYRKLIYASLAAHGIWLLAVIYIVARSR